jgi:hypothetical protein
LAGVVHELDNATRENTTINLLVGRRDKPGDPLRAI